MLWELQQYASCLARSHRLHLSKSRRIPRSTCACIHANTHAHARTRTHMQTPTHFTCIIVHAMYDMCMRFSAVSQLQRSHQSVNINKVRGTCPYARKHIRTHKHPQTPRASSHMHMTCFSAHFTGVKNIKHGEAQASATCVAAHSLQVRL